MTNVPSGLFGSCWLVDGDRELVVRVNAADTPWHDDDLNAVAGSQANAVLLPKVNGPEDVASAGRALRVAGAATDLGLWVMAETPDAIRQIDLIATAEPALQAIVMGNNDLAKALRLPADPLDYAPSQWAVGILLYEIVVGLDDLELEGR